MPTRLTSVVIDSRDAKALGRWWAQALDWRIEYEDDEETDVVPPDGEPGIELTFVPVPEEKTVKNPVHLDLASSSSEGQSATVARLLAAGATPADIGQGDVPWVVLADPEGNEFCVLDPRPAYGDTGAIAAIVVEADDLQAQAEFWVQVAGGGIESASPTDYGIRLSEKPGPWLEFTRSSSQHTVKNRLHLDVAAFKDEPQSAEVERVLGLGARHIDVGQSSDVTWVVLADPEGNEFCILSSR